ncbi:hypothetical protein QCA50_010641 [Cerrena zonata]|uniref:CCAAT-binding factor domain-containing protein n=1 Tax=Cerrena zonata TaxID=2478898 RepID=A0AAW0G4H3_9APHY
MAPPSSLPNSHKKRRAEQQSGRIYASSIQQLEEQVTAAVASKGSLNPLADLLDIAQEATDPSSLTKALYALYRSFVTILTNGLLTNTPANEEARTVRTWVNDRLHEYTELLVSLLKDEDTTIRTSALKILLSIQKHLSSSLSKAESSSKPQPQFHISHFKRIVYGLLFCPPSPRSNSSHKRTKAESSSPKHDGKVELDVRDLFVEDYLSVHDDVRWFFLRESANLLSTWSKSEHPNAADNLLSFLESLTTFPTDSAELNSWLVEELGARPPKAKTSNAEDDEDETEEPEKTPNGEDEDDWRKFFEDEVTVEPKSTDPKKPSVRLHKLTIHQSVHSLASHRAMFTRTWLALLPLLSIGPSEQSKALTTRALNVMHRGVLPHLTRAILVMDWIANCVDYGGTVGLLALNGLFTLIKEYNLDYPSFYTRLYAFLDRDVLHVKHRARFFRLTELFLSSTLLPATLLASFVKRLARLSLTAPPAAIIMLIPFTYNILKKHPALMVMIHRAEDMASGESDPFNASEPNPTLTNAIESSLWELHTQRQHYHSSVSTLVRIFEEAFTKPSYSLEDFLDHTYTTLYETEAKRRIKKEPALAMEPTQKRWFITAETEEETTLVDRVDTLWSFS